MLNDRYEAGIHLAAKLSEYHGTNAIVLTLPRGGVEVAYEIAKSLELPLDVLSIRKIGHPQYPELAIGAINEKGEVLFDKDVKKSVSQLWIENAIDTEQKEAARQLSRYKIKEPIPLNNKTVIIVDDGAETGVTLKLAIAAVKTQAPAKIIIAVPVISEDALKELSEMVDEIVMIESYENFKEAVSDHYKDFDPVSDVEAVDLLLKTY